jgi:photosystem II stability/assembly factor-like uncharacterized protein
MKKLILLFLLFPFLQYNILHSQSGWIKVYACDNSGIGIHFFNQNTGYLINGSGNTYKSTNNGINWISYSATTGIIPMSCYFFTEDNYLITGYSDNHVFGWVGIWKDGIRTDSWFTPTLSYLGLTTTDWINKDTGYVAGSDFDMGSYIGKVFRTTNRGLNWTDITPSTSLYINSIKFINANTGFIIQPFFEKTTNMGNNWTRISDTSGADFHIVNLDTIYIANNNGRVNISTNGGSAWLARNTGVNFNINKIKFVNSKTGWIIGKNGTIMRTTNCGVNWQLQMGGLQNITLRDLFILNENYIWVSGDSGTVKGLVFRTSTGGASFVKKIANNLPDKYELYQNNPNPFNPTTNIKYQISNNLSQQVTLKVYDMLGKEIATLVNEKQSPGMYEVTFDGSNFASGVYFYRIQAGDFVQVKKMLMIK